LAAGCFLGGPYQPAGRQSAEVRALPQARRPARPHLPWPGRPEDAGHADRRQAGTCRRSTASAPTAAQRPRRPPRAGAVQLGASTAAERELFAASLDADPQYIETVLAVAQKAALPALSVRVGNAAWDQRDKITGYDGAMYPLPPWQPAGGFSLDKALVYGFMRQESAFNPKARSFVGAMGLMQLMPATARLVANRYAPSGRAAIHYDPSINISLGQGYIASLLSDVDNNLVRTVAATTAGRAT
jgi:soluble lytic murein transglycosylase-like protein